MNETENFKQYKLAKIDLTNPSNAHDFQIILTGKKKKVLEVGTSTGYITEILKKHNCKITGIEENPDFAASAEKFTEKMIIGDVESLELSYHLKNKKFDVILLGDVLEHLKDPSIFLKKLHPFLEKDGYLVCSIPNISHIVIRLQLLNGNFDYTSTGLLDDDHLQYYTLKTISSLLTKADFKFEKLHRVKSEFYLPHRSDLDQSLFPLLLVDCILNDPESETYQYVFSAKPSFNSEKPDPFLTLKKEDLPTAKLKKIIEDKMTLANDFSYSIDENKKQKGVMDHLENAIKEKDIVIQTLENAVKDKDGHIEKVIRDKDAHIEKVIRDKDAHLEEVIRDKDKQMESVMRHLESSILGKFFKKYDKLSGKSKSD